MINLRKLAAFVCGLALFGATADATTHINGQILAYQDGFVFFTDGNGFKVAPDVKVLDADTSQPTPTVPRPRMYARAVFNTVGQVVEIDLAKKAYPLEPLSPLVASYVVQASPTTRNPDMEAHYNASFTKNGIPIRFTGKQVLVTLTVLVPPTTPLNAQVYIATDQSSWNPQAIQMDRIDTLHFRVTRSLASGTSLYYIYTRGSLQSEERAENGLSVEPHELIVHDADVRTINDEVYQWADQSPLSTNRIQPNVVPTPYNPAPFPNLPAGIPTPHA